MYSQHAGSQGYWRCLSDRVLGLASRRCTRERESTWGTQRFEWHGRRSCLMWGLRWWHRSLHSMPMLHYFLLICFGCKSRGVFNGVQAMSAETTSNFIHLAELWSCLTRLMFKTEATAHLYWANICVSLCLSGAIKFNACTECCWRQGVISLA